MATAWIVILCLLLLLFSFIFLGTGAVYVQEAKKERSAWTRAPGTVKHSKLHVVKGSSVPYFPTTDQKSYTNTVEFTALDGRAFSVEFGDTRALPVDQPITVHYAATDPEHTARLTSPTGKLASGYTMQVVSVVLLLGAGGIGYLYFLR